MSFIIAYPSLFVIIGRTVNSLKFVGNVASIKYTL